MTLELVKAIKEAESIAEKTIRDTQQEARQLFRQAEESASATRQKVIAAAEEEAKRLLRQAEAEAEAELQPLREKQQAAIAGLRDEAGGRLKEAVALLIEKVVKTYADH